MKEKLQKERISKRPITDLTDDEEAKSVVIEIPKAFFLNVKELVERNKFSGTIKGSWTKMEDQILSDLVNENGPRRWSSLSKHMCGRSGKQCRERWLNHLDPNLDHTDFRPEEDLKIIELHSLYGNQWAKISRFMKGRTANRVKNRWNSYLCKKEDFMLRPSTSLREEDDDDNDDNEEHRNGHEPMSNEREGEEEEEEEEEEMSLGHNDEDEINELKDVLERNLLNVKSYERRFVPFTFTSAPQQELYDRNEIYRNKSRN